MSDRIRSASLYQQIYQDLRRKIESGELPGNTKLPTEKELGEAYGVSRITTKKATDLLEADGYIQKFPGKGTFVSPASHDHPAQEMIKPSTRLVGIVLDHISDSFGVRTLIALESLLGRAGYSCVVKFSDNDAACETACIDKLLALNVCGLIIKCACLETYNDRILELSLQNFPMLFIDRHLPGLRVPYVGIQHANACEELSNRLFSRGHKNLAIVYCDKSSTMTSVAERIDGFTRSCLLHQEVGLHQLVLPGDASMNVPAEDFERVIDQSIAYFNAYPQISGAVALSDGIGQLLCVAANRIKAESGRVIEIASFDSSVNHISGYEPVLSVKQDEDTLAQQCADLMLKISAGETVDKFNYTPYTICQYK